MTIYAVLLRAINVGGHNKIPMAELRTLLDELGFGDVATYIQSGNIVCSSRKKPASVASTIKSGIAERFGHDIEVIVRSGYELAQIVADFPYPEANPKSSGIMFLSEACNGTIDATAFAPDVCRVGGAQVFVNCPNGFGSTKLTGAWIEKQAATSGTMRNFATVLKLRDMTLGS